MFKSISQRVLHLFDEVKKGKSNPSLSKSKNILGLHIVSVYQKFDEDKKEEYKEAYNKLTEGL